MPLAAGTRLGPYEIVSPIGAGGMGEVYRARDTRLDRSVAIKVLPAEFANDAQLRLRFEREAKTILIEMAKAGLTYENRRCGRGISRERGDISFRRLDSWVGAVSGALIGSSCH